MMADPKRPNSSTPTFESSKTVDFQNKNHELRPRLKVANSASPIPNPMEGENRHGLLEKIRELERRHVKDVQQIKGLKEELDSKNLELSRRVPVPYGSYCNSGATPHLLALHSEKVLIGLVNFVLFTVRPETSIETVNSLKARVSEVFFSKFEQIDFGVKGESLFTTPGLLPEESFTEFRAFLAYADDPEDEAVKSYMPKYERFFKFKLAKLQKTCDQVDVNDASCSAHFRNLAMNVWMLHKLTFSFERANVRVMRVVRNEPFNGKYMESVGQQDEGQLIKGKTPAATTTVKHVILPGFWMNESVIKCRVCLGSATGQEPSTAPAPATQLREDDAVNGTGPRNVDVTPKQAHQPTSSQVPDSEAPTAHAHVHQPTQAMDCTETDEPHVSGASNPLQPDDELDRECRGGGPSREGDTTNMDDSPPEELEATSAASATSVSDNVQQSEHHGNRPYHGSQAWWQL